MRNLSNKFDYKKIEEYALILGYFLSLASATLFFFDVHRATLFDKLIELPVGLIFFPLTFAFSNIIQDRYGKIVANSVTLLVFIFDTILVLVGLFMSSLGDRQDYWSVFKDTPLIMFMTWFLLGIGATFNIILYSLLKKRPASSLLEMLIKFFITITATEILISSLSMPIMFYKHGLEGSLLLTITITVLYKVFANVIITMTYSIFIKK
ncbi:VUT family protein [Rickettsiales bacterium LUAb2]